jgi:hypothetical protein
MPYLSQEAIPMAERELSDLLAAELKFSANDRADLEKNEQKWRQDFEDFERAVRESAVITEKDLAVRINVRDSDS